MQDIAPPSTPPLTRADLGEVIGGGFIVGRREPGGRLVVANHPFEHGDREKAFAEAARLSKDNPGRVFVVLRVTEAVLVDAIENVAAAGKRVATALNSDHLRMKSNVDGEQITVSAEVV